MTINTSKPRHFDRREKTQAITNYESKINNHQINNHQINNQQINNQNMETVTIHYKKSNRAAKQILKGMFATGFFEIEKHKTGLELALEDVEAGRITTYKSTKELFEKLKA